MLQHSLALLRRLRHRRLLRQALQAPAALAAKPPHHLLQSLAERQFDAWRDGRMPPLDSFEACLRRLHDEHPSIYVYDIDGPHVLARRKTGRAAEHPFDPVYARVYPKRLNQYGALLAEVLRTSGIRYRFSIAIDLRDTPRDESLIPVFAFQRRIGCSNPLLPDVDFFHHRWYVDDLDGLNYDDKTISACFAGASTGRSLSVNDVRQHASERLTLAAAFQTSRRVKFRIASAVHCEDAEAEAMLRAQPYFSAPIPWAEQLRHRFLISVDGNGATCSRVVKALRSQSVLVKFASDYELFYFPLLQPGVHYLPARNAADVEHLLDVEAASPGCYRVVAQSASALAQQLFSAPAVLSYTRALVDRYAAIFPRA